MGVVSGVFGRLSLFFPAYLWGAMPQDIVQDMAEMQSILKQGLKCAGQAKQDGENLVFAIAKDAVVAAVALGGLVYTLAAVDGK